MRLGPSSHCHASQRPTAVPVLPCPSSAGPDHPSLVSSPHASSIPQSTNPPCPCSTSRPRCHCSTLSPLPALTTRVAGVTWSHVGTTPNHAVRSGWEPLCCAARARVLFPLTSLPASSSFLVCHLHCFSCPPFSAPSQESQPQSVLSLGTLTSIAAALKASGLCLFCLPVTGSGQCRVPPATRASLPPQREALCHEHFLSGSDLLLLAAAEAGWGRGTEPGGVLVLVGVGGSGCIGASLVNLEIPGPVSTALPSHPLRLLSSPPAEGQTGGLQN